MKKIEAIVRFDALEQLKEALLKSEVTGMTISEVHGCGNQHGWKEYFRGAEVSVNLLPKLKFEIIVNDEEVDPMVEIIQKAVYTGETGDGKIFVLPIDNVVRIRTGESGEAAI